MSISLFVLVVIAVWVLVSRISALQKRVEQLEQSLARLLREGRVAAPAVEPASARVREFEPPPATPPPPAARAPSPPRESVLIGWIRDYFTGGNLVVRVGIIVLFFGVGFLLKYAVEHTQLSIEVRLAAAAIGAAVLFALGWRLRHRRRGFALALQGGAIGVLYLILYSSLHLYQLLTPGLAFVLMAGLGIASLLLATRQDSLAFAMLGAIGGYLAPLLASTGEGNHVVLFGYYALLTLAIVAQAWFKAWRPLNLLAFVFVFGIGTAWGVLRYDPAQYASTQPFLAFFFLAFVAIAVLFALRSAPQLTHYVDGTLVFGTPLVAMGLQMQLVRDLPHGRLISALAGAILYLALAAWLYRTRRDSLRMLMEAFLAIGVAFFTLALPLAFDDSWTAVAWALEGAALYWVGVRQRRMLPRAAGVALQLVAGALFVTRVAGGAAVMPLANAGFLGAIYLAAAGLFSARVAAKHGLERGPDDHFMGPATSNGLLAWGLCWWLLAAGNEMHRFLPDYILPGALLALCAATAFAAALLGRRLSWPALRVPALLVLPAMLLAAAWWLSQAAHPASRAGWLGWPLTFVALWCALRWHEAAVPRRLAVVMHLVTLWLACLLASVELGWWVGELTQQGSTWARASWSLVPVAALALLTGSAVGRHWPLRAFQDEFRGWGGTGLALALLLWAAWFNIRSDGAAAPLPYLPLLNPLDISVAVALWTIASWLMAVWTTGERLFPLDTQRWRIGILVLVTFAWLNAVLLRTMHHWRGVPWRFDALMNDTAVQAALSIFWTLLAMGAMLWANRSGQRIVWFGAAGLMAVVVAKLFLVDLASIGTVARIVSFLGVGGLMLVMGYYSPLPPVASSSAPLANRARDID